MRPPAPRCHPIPEIDFISFTGSPEVGTLIQSAAARNHIGCTMELGGKSPHVLFADADLDVAIPVIANTMVQNAGQTCSAGSRLLIEKSGSTTRPRRRLAEKFAALRAGTPEMDLDLGPVINATQKQRIQRFFDRAEEDGVPVLSARLQVAEGVPEGAYFVEPRVYGPVPRGNDLAAKEDLRAGPLGAALRRTKADAVALANDTDYGLMAAVWSHDGNRALRVARGIRAGQVYVNSFGAGGGIELPFGGMKKSGHGREKGFAALHDMSTLRTTIIKHG